MSVSKGSAEGEGRKKGRVGGIVRPGFKFSRTQKQLEYARPQGNNLPIIHIACFLTCLYQSYVLERTRNNHRKLFQVYLFWDDFLLIIVILTQ